MTEGADHALPGTLAELDPVRVRPTAEPDLEWVVKLEHAPENSPFVGQWSRKRHREVVDSPDWAHWMVEAADRDGGAVGYLLLAGLGSPVFELVRMVISAKGRGYGRATLRLVKRAAFEHWGAHRLWLDVMRHNDRAHGLYLSEGFIQEGVFREAARSRDRWVDLIVLSMLAHEYSGV